MCKRARREEEFLREKDSVCHSLYIYYIFLDCMNNRYGDKYDHRQLMTSLNQKCRDSGRSSV